MSVLFGAHGMASALSPQAGAELIEPMRRRATGTVGALAATAHLRGDGFEFAVCRRHRAGEAEASPFARSGPLWLALRGRLDDRAGLRQRIGLPADADPPDAALLLAAYERLGIDCVQQLCGDWAFALWDAPRQRLLLARDATGNSALYWWQGAGRILFATSLQTLLAAPPVPSRPNPRWLAGLLTVFYDPALPGATAFVDVHAVPPGHLVIAEASGARLERWWRPETLPMLDDRPLPELEQRFLSLYDDAVRTRLRRPGGAVAATLSGGLDSGSVVALAAPALAEQGQRLTAYVHTPLFDPGGEHAGRTADEWPLAQATALHVGRVDTVACPTATISPVEGIRRWLDTAAAPSHAAGNWFWLQDIAGQAAEGGARVLLIGHGGNATVSYAGSGNLWPRLRDGRWATLWRELSGEAGGWPAALRDRLVKPALRPAWQRLKRSGRPAAAGPPWAGYSLLSDALADEMGLRSAMRAARHDPGFATSSHEQVMRFRLSFHGGADNGTALWSELGARHGLEVVDPTRDRRLVELCRQLPDEMFWAHGAKRGLIRQSMRSRLPPAVLHCAHKGLQAADLRQRLQACRQDLLDEVDAVSRHPLVRQWIDTPRLARSAAAAVAEPVQPAPDAVQPVHLLLTLAAAMFIARHG